MITAVLSEKNKNLEYITNQVLHQTGIECALHFLSEENIGFFDNPASFTLERKEDDYDKIEEDIRRSDAIILSCFSYLGKIDGRMATFMDRTYPLLKDKKLKGKLGAGICVSEKREDTFLALSEINNFFLQHGIIPVSPPYPYSLTGVSSWAKLENEITEDYYSIDVARKLGEELKEQLSS